MEEEHADPHAEEWDAYDATKEAWWKEEVEREQHIWDRVPVADADTDAWPAWAVVADECSAWDAAAEMNFWAIEATIAAFYADR